MLYKGSHYNYIIGNNSACLVMNMKTGKQLKIADTCVEDVQIALDTNPHEIDETMYDCFIKSGMLVPEDVDEARLLELQYNDMVYGTDVLYVMIAPTNDCNFRYTYCFEYKQPEYMSINVEENVLKFLDSKIPYCKQLRLSWFGGEPLLCKEQIIRMSEHINKTCKSHHVPIYGEISTNGYELDYETFKALLRNHITDYQICVDGPQRFHNITRPHCFNNDSYERIMSNLIKIKNEVTYGHFKIMIRTNVTPQVSDFMEEHITQMNTYFGDDNRFVLIYQCVRDWGGDEISNGQIVSDESAEYSKLYGLSTDVGINSASSLSFAPIVGNCQANRKNGFLIDHLGNLRKCSLAQHNSEHCEIDKIGYIAKGGKAVIDDYKLSKWLVRNFVISDSCKTCVLYPFCMGGHCPYSNNILNQRNCNKYILTFLKEHLLQLDKQGRIKTIHL